MSLADDAKKKFQEAEDAMKNVGEDISKEVEKADDKFHEEKGRMEERAEQMKREHDNK